MNGINNTKKKLYIIPIFLVSTFLVTSVSYAFFQETLTVDGVVTTSNFSIIASLPSFGAGYISGDNEPPEKDIGYIDDVTIVQDTNTFTITIKDAYPCYEAWVLLGIENNGDLPVHIKEIIFDNVPSELEIWLEPYQFPGQPVIPIMEIQLHHGEEYWFWVYIHVFEDDEADPPVLPQQNTDYQFSVTVRAIQYNYHQP